MLKSWKKCHFWQIYGNLFKWRKYVAEKNGIQTAQIYIILWDHWSDFSLCHNIWNMNMVVIFIFFLAFGIYSALYKLGQLRTFWLELSPIISNFDFFADVTFSCDWCLQFLAFLRLRFLASFKWDRFQPSRNIKYFFQVFWPIQVSL